MKREAVNLSEDGVLTVVHRRKAQLIITEEACERL